MDDPIKMEEFIHDCCDICEKMHPFEFIPLICTMIYTYSEAHDLGKYGCKNLIGAIVNNMLEPNGEALDPLKRLL